MTNLCGSYEPRKSLDYVVAYVLKSRTEIAAQIRQSRRILGWSQEKLAEQIGRPGSQAQVSRWERAEEAPNLMSLTELAKAFGKSMEFLFLELAGDGEDWVNGLELQGTWESAPVYLRTEDRPRASEADAVLTEELDQLREWLPDETARRMTRKLTPRVWLGMLYALVAEEPSPREKLERIHQAIRRHDEAESRRKAGPGGS